MIAVHRLPERKPPAGQQDLLWVRLRLHPPVLAGANNDTALEVHHWRRRRGAWGVLGIFVAAGIALCACAPAEAPVLVTTSTPSASATSGTAAWVDSSDLPDVVAFSDGEGLRSGSWQVRWNHTGLWGGGYTYVLSTGGQDEGLWDYTQNATGCDILLIQAQDVEGADDLAASDDALAEFSEMNPSALGGVSTTSYRALPRKPR